MVPTWTHIPFAGCCSIPSLQIKVSHPCCWSITRRNSLSQKPVSKILMALLKGGLLNSFKISIKKSFKQYFREPGTSPEPHVAAFGGCPTTDLCPNNCLKSLCFFLWEFRSMKRVWSKIIQCSNYLLLLVLFAWKNTRARAGGIYINPRDDQ